MEWYRYIATTGGTDAPSPLSDADLLTKQGGCFEGSEACAGSSAPAQHNYYSQQQKSTTDCFDTGSVHHPSFSSDPLYLDSQSQSSVLQARPLQRGPPPTKQCQQASPRKRSPVMRHIFKSPSSKGRGGKFIQQQANFKYQSPQNMHWVGGNQQHTVTTLGI